MNIFEIDKNHILLENFSCFDPFISCDCGQAFRWKITDENNLEGIVFDRVVHIKKTNNGFIFDCDRDFFENVLVSYFDLERDYDKILSSYDDEHIKKCIKEYYGIRILKQDEFETLISFIISQNNNIPRIKGIIERLCKNFGEKISGDCYAFPTAEKIASLTLEELSLLRAGFRAKYILDAAQKIQSGEISLEKIKTMELENASFELMKIKGVGKKVAACTLLFGFGMLDSFPVDVWINRILEKHYPNGLPKCFDGSRGLAQQYMFTYAINKNDM